MKPSYQKKSCIQNTSPHPETENDKEISKRPYYKIDDEHRLQLLNMVLYMNNQR